MVFDDEVTAGYQGMSSRSDPPRTAGEHHYPLYVRWQDATDTDPRCQAFGLERPAAQPWSRPPQRSPLTGDRSAVPSLQHRTTGHRVMWLLLLNGQSEPYVHG